ncbi:hypothetical protein DICA2_C06106 [Diutina catenulata]
MIGIGGVFTIVLPIVTSIITIIGLYSTLRPFVFPVETPPRQFSNWTNWTIQHVWRCDELFRHQWQFHEYAPDKVGGMHLLLYPDGQCQCEICDNCSSVGFDWVNFEFNEQTVSALVDLAESTTSMSKKAERDYTLHEIHTSNVTVFFQFRPKTTWTNIYDSYYVLDRLQKNFRRRLEHGKMPDALCLVAGNSCGPIYRIVYGSNADKVQTVPCREGMPMTRCKWH